MDNEREILTELKGHREDVTTLLTKLDSLEKLNHETRISQLERQVAASGLNMLKSGGVGAAVAAVVQWLIQHGGF